MIDGKDNQHGYPFNFENLITEILNREFIGYQSYGHELLYKKYKQRARKIRISSNYCIIKLTNCSEMGGRT